MLDWQQHLPCSISRDEFWAAVDVWVMKPHVVNRRLWGISKLHTFEASNPKGLNIYENLTALVSSLESEEIVAGKQTCLQFLSRKTQLDFSAIEGTPEIEVIVVKQLPKLASEHAVFQVVIEDYVDDVAYFIEISRAQKHALGPKFPYCFQHSKTGITLKGKSETTDERSVAWLKVSVLPQIVKWAAEASGQAHTARHGLCSGSLNLVEAEQYYTKYNELKLKYGKEMVKMWPECTDPAKFVYEDVAIATYLLVLWQSERKRLGVDRLQSFADLGCGNGLLVYLLASEGHSGWGVDVRKRKIWASYPDFVVLKEETVSPSNEHLYPEVDWIIGNHSDELTPWVPVIAARSSYKSNFFLLPCCCYKFNGNKYERKDSSKSQYNEYLEYIYKLCQDCGFKTSLDRLKIPSTKRIALIGTDRTYSEEKFQESCSKIREIISEDNEGGEWISDFKPREQIEKVRNCTRVDKTVINSIVKIISEHLMRDCVSGEPWSVGAEAGIGDVVSLIPEHLLKQLKSECGGLQTLLRNHNQIFKVVSGRVQLRYPQTLNEITTLTKNRKKSKLTGVGAKNKACWFYSNHPQGCPLTADECSFVHCAEEEIK